MKNKLIKKYQKGGNYLVTYTNFDKLKGYKWYDGTEPPSYRHPIVLPVFNEDFAPKLYIQEAEQFAKEHPDGEQLVYLNPVVIKPLDGKILDNANFSGGKRVNKLIDSQGRVIFENKTGLHLRDLIEVNYDGGKGYVDWDPWTNKKKLVAYQLPNDLLPRELPEGYDVNSLEDEWNLQHNINYLNWKEPQSNKSKVTEKSFYASNSPIGKPIATLLAGVMGIPVLQAFGAEKLTEAITPYITKGVNYLKNLRTPSSMTLHGPGYGTINKSVWRNLGEQALASTAGFEGMNLVSKSIAGKNWGDAVRSILPDGPKWMPEWSKLILSEATNVGGWASPNTFYKGYNTLANNLSNVVLDKYHRIPVLKNFWIKAKSPQNSLFNAINPSLKYLPKEHVTMYQGSPKLLNNWLYNIIDEIKNISKNNNLKFKNFALSLKNAYQNHTLRNTPVPSEFKSYIKPTLQRLLPSLRSYIESLVPDVYLETDNLLTGKNSLGYWDKKLIKLRKTFPKNYSKASMFGHEARHAIDDKVFLTKDQINMLNDAYDWDNLDLVPGYNMMNKEKVTTNVDARNLLFDSYHDKNIRNYSVDQQNQIIDSYSDQAIVDFVKKSNGYGKRYINYLKKNNKLIPEKIQQFREAMKYVPAITPFIIPNNNE